MSLIAFVSGASGQIGSYLSEILLEQGYFVWGLRRTGSILSQDFPEYLLTHPRFQFIYGDITDTPFISEFLTQHLVSLFINCASQSNSQVSFLDPAATIEINGNSVIRCLEALKQYSPTTRFITLGSSEIFQTSAISKNEQSPVEPQSPYAKAKLMAQEAVKQYRKDHSLFACNAIVFNSESPRRSERYVSRKITKAAARIKLGLQKTLFLGNLTSSRDFIHAQNTADAIYKIITANQPDDFVVCSGKMHSVQDWLEIGFGTLGLNWKDYVETDPQYIRANNEVCHLGNNNKIKSQLGWQETHSFEYLVNEMIEYDLKVELQ